VISGDSGQVNSAHAALCDTYQLHPPRNGENQGKPGTTRSCENGQYDVLLISEFPDDEAELALSVGHSVLMPKFVLPAEEKL